MRIGVKGYALIGTAVLVIMCVLMSIYRIDAGERGVVLTNGKVTDVVQAGLHCKIPVFQSVVKMSTRWQKLSLKKVAMYSHDQQTAEFAVSLAWKYDEGKMGDIYSRYGKDRLVDTVLVPRVLEVTKTVFGRYTAADAVQKRDRLNNDMVVAVKEICAGVPCIIDNVQVENIDFSDAYEHAVEAAAKAKADVERSKSELLRVEQEAQQRVMQAKADAEAKQRLADAEAYAVTTKGRAEAEAIAARGKALRENPELVGLIQAERWDGKLPETMLPSSAIPIIGGKH